MRRLGIAVMIVTVLAISFMLQGTQGQDDSDQRISALETRVAALESAVGLQPPVTEIAASGVGVPMSSGNWTITAVGSEFVNAAAPGTSIEVTTNGAFLVIYFQITNNSASPAEFPFTTTKVTDGEGRTFDANEEATVAFQINLYGNTPRTLEMQPGIPYDYSILYEVPPDATGFVFSDGTIEIQLGI